MDFDGWPLTDENDLSVLKGLLFQLEGDVHEADQKLDRLLKADDRGLLQHRELRQRLERIEAKLDKLLTTEDEGA